MDSRGYEEINEPLHFVTPLRHSKKLSQLLPGPAEVYMKMENCQPSGSYKIRGVGRLARKVRPSFDVKFVFRGETEIKNRRNYHKYENILGSYWLFLL